MVDRMNFDKKMARSELMGMISTLMNKDFSDVTKISRVTILLKSISDRIYEDIRE